MPYQLTIQRPVETRGVGLHTAVRCHLRLLPAPADTGIVFRRVDLDNFEIEAHVRNVARVSYATSLMKQGVLLSTVEHLLAALYSCGVDNVYVELDALELPILDGSSKPFIELLAQAGIRKLRRQRRYIHVIKPLEFSDGDRRIGIYPADEFRVHCFVDYKHPDVGPQEVDDGGPSIFQPGAGAGAHVWIHEGFCGLASDGIDSRRLGGKRNRAGRRRHSERPAAFSG